MKPLMLAPMAALALCGTAAADDLQDIRAALHGFNEAAGQPKPEDLRRFFSAGADYRDCGTILKGVDAIMPLFTERRPWSETTRPILREDEIRLIGPSAAMVDATVVQYGSMVLKSNNSGYAAHGKASRRLENLVLARDGLRSPHVVGSVVILPGECAPPVEPRSPAVSAPLKWSPGKRATALP